MTDTDRPEHTDEYDDDHDELMTITEVSDFLRVPVATLRYWRHLGIGPASFKIGRGIRYLRSTVLQWLREQQALAHGSSTTTSNRSTNISTPTYRAHRA